MAWPMFPVSPMIDEMLMIRPVPRSSMCGITAWLMKNAPDRLTAITLYQSSSVIFSHALVAGDAGVVDEHVEPAVALDHLVDGPAAVVGRADVALMDARRDVVLLELVQQLLGILLVAAVAGGEDRALLGEAAADRGADPARATGHEHHASLHPRPAMPRRKRLVCRNDGVRDVVSSAVSVSVLMNPSPPWFRCQASERSASHSAMCGHSSLRAAEPATSPM